MDAGGHATRYSETTRQRLDIAVLNFFQSFRKVYIGEQVGGGGLGGCGEVFARYGGGWGGCGEVLRVFEGSGRSLGGG